MILKKKIMSEMKCKRLSWTKICPKIIADATTKPETITRSAISFSYKQSNIKYTKSGNRWELGLSFTANVLECHAEER